MSLLRILQDCAILAPSCFNNQPWRFVFVYDKTKLVQLFDALAKANAWAKRASLIIAVSSSPGSDCQIKGRDYYLFDTGMACCNLIMRATERGLVAHPIAGYDEQKVKTLLRIPEEMIVITLIIIGGHSDTINLELTEKQAKKEKKRSERIPLNQFYFVDEYGKTVSSL